MKLEICKNKTLSPAAFKSAVKIKERWNAMSLSISAKNVWISHSTLARTNKHLVQILSDEGK
jgi:hypothetical protein